MADGLIEGDPEGTSEGVADGLLEGDPEGTSEGKADGFTEGIVDGLTEGAPDGSRSARVPIRAFFNVAQTTRLIPQSWLLKWCC